MSVVLEEVEIEEALSDWSVDERVGDLCCFLKHFSWCNPGASEEVTEDGEEVSARFRLWCPLLRCAY